MGVSLIFAVCTDVAAFYVRVINVVSSRIRRYRGFAASVTDWIDHPTLVLVIGANYFPF